MQKYTLKTFKPQTQTSQNQFVHRIRFILATFRSNNNMQMHKVSVVYIKPIYMEKICNRSLGRLMIIAFV